MRLLRAATKVRFRIGIALIVVLCLGSPAFAQGDPPRVSLLSGSLAFPAVTLTGNAITTNGATSVPTLQFTDGVKAIGWNATFQASALTNGVGSIPASNLFFTASGGTLTRVSGDFVDPTNGPRETGSSGTLDVAIKVVNAQSGFGKGRYNYTPLASNFRITIPATALVGTYSGTLTVSITSGP